MKNSLIVSSPGGEMKTGYICPQVKINIMGIDFLANPVVLKSWGDRCHFWDGLVKKL
jgi:hypothetical protein